MKLLKNNKTKVLEILRLLTEMLEKGEEVYKLTNPSQYGDNNGWWFVDYYNMLDIVYLNMVGHRQPHVYGSFKTSTYTQMEKPIAWYKTQYSSKNDGSIKPPKLIEEHLSTCYIPDMIDEVIYTHKLDYQLKYKLLLLMFQDLIKLHNKYYKKKKNEKS